MTKTVNVPNLSTRALKYATNGWRVVPMHAIQEGHCTCQQGARCKNPGKHPMTLHGVKDATIDENTIKKWWSDNPNANIGIATGKAVPKCLRSTLTRVMAVARR